LAERIDLPLLWTAQEKASGLPRRLTLDHFLTFRPSPSWNRSHRASGMDGTASLANRDFSRVLRTNRREVVFSGAAHRANEAAGAGYFAASGGESAKTGLGGGAR
jgi:hypothetical protein